MLAASQHQQNLPPKIRQAHANVAACQLSKHKCLCTCKQSRNKARLVVVMSAYHHQPSLPTLAIWPTPHLCNPRSPHARSIQGHSHTQLHSPPAQCKCQCRLIMLTAITRARMCLACAHTADSVARLSTQQHLTALLFTHHTTSLCFTQHRTYKPTQPSASHTQPHDHSVVQTFFYAQC
jgi:hypothetical protein